MTDVSSFTILENFPKNRIPIHNNGKLINDTDTDTQFNHFTYCFPNSDHYLKCSNNQQFVVGYIFPRKK